MSLWVKFLRLDFSQNTTYFTTVMKTGLIILGLIGLTCLGRIPFATKYILVHDSVGFALALKEFDLYKHQPQTPGFILYVGLAKLLNFFVHDANTSYVILSILFSSLSVVFIYLLGKSLFNSRCGIVSALFLWSSPTFWVYGEMALSYICDTFTSVFVAYMGYQVIIKGKRHWLSGWSIALGILAGIRLYPVVFLSFMWIFALVSIKSWKEILKQICILVTVCLCWGIPLLILTGGLPRFIDISLSHYRSAALPQLKSFKTLAYTVAATVWGLSAIILSLIISLKRLTSYENRTHLVTFFIIWGGVAFFFLFIFFIGNPGQILIFLPCFILLSSLFVYKRARVTEYTLVGLIIFINCFLYFTVRPLSANERILGINTHKFRNFANFWILDHSNKKLRSREQFRELLDVIDKNFSPDTTAIITSDTRYLQPCALWRVVYYYLPEFQVVKITDTTQVTDLPPNINTLVWLFDKYHLDMKLVETLLAYDKEVYFSTIKDTLRMRNLVFVTSRE